MSRLVGGQGGAALPIAVSVLLIVILLTGVAVAYSVRSVDRSNFDRNSARALAAADAGLEVARYRMNKVLLGGQVVGTVGLVADTVGALACTDLGLDALGDVSVRVSGSQEWCVPGGWEALDGDGYSVAQGTEICEQGQSAAFRYFLRLQVGAEVAISDQGVVNNEPVAWQVVSAGCANGRVAAVRGTYPVGLTGALSSGGLLQLFKLEDYAQCGGLEFNPADPDAGC